MTTMWASTILIPVLLLGGGSTGIFPERKAVEPPSRTKAMVIEGADGLHIRMEVSDRAPKTMTIRGLDGGRVQMEWDDKLAIESHSFVMNVPADERKGASSKTTFDSSAEGSVTMTIDQQGDNSVRNRMTCRLTSASFQFDSLTVTVN
jgi:hypothetical protein